MHYSATECPDPGDFDCSQLGFTDASLGEDPLLVLGIAAASFPASMA
jgi:hypothetical protein